jgi:hypothetical protein
MFLSANLESNMNRFAFIPKLGTVLFALLGLLLTTPALSQEPAAVKMQRFKAVVDLSITPPTVMMEGIASHLGKFTGKGQVVFTAGEQPGTRVGSGPVILRAANGDWLVGTVTWTVNSTGSDSFDGSLHFRWSDSVTLGDGTVVESTGRFVAHRPPGVRIPVVGQVIGAFLMVIAAVDSAVH